MHCPWTHLHAVLLANLRMDGGAQAVESLNKVAEQLSDAHLLEFFVPLIRRLAQGDWFTSRISACGLFGVGYGRMSAAIKSEMRMCAARPPPRQARPRLATCRRCAHSPVCHAFPSQQ